MTAPNNLPELDGDQELDVADVCQNIRDQLQWLLVNTDDDNRDDVRLELSDIEDVLAEVMESVDDVIDEDHDDSAVDGPNLLPEDDDEGVEDDDDEDWG